MTTVTARLYSAEGQHLCDATYSAPEDGFQPTVLDASGRTFVWAVRAGQYREVSPVTATTVPGSEPAPAPAPAPESPAAEPAAPTSNEKQAPTRTAKADAHSDT
jgi:hypothetical protein